MKQLQCEMCGGTDLIKQDGVFVCQSCGVKYSVEEAKRMMVEVEGTVEVKGTVKIDSTDKVETYKEMAINAYSAGNTSEAYEYFLKVLEIDPTDYQSIFYKGMCQGWQTSIARPRVGEAVAAYHQAEEYIPPEIAQKIKELFISDLINLMSAWFDKAQQRYYDVEDWYQSNTDIYFTYKRVSQQVVTYIKGFMTTVISSESASLLENVGELYCSACEALCSTITIWTDYSKERAIFSGYSSRDKQPILRDYENMIFEVRKYHLNFRKADSKYGVIDRMDPPTSLGVHNLRTTDINYEKCIEVDRVINQKVEKYKADKLQKEKEERERKFWESHPEDKPTHDTLKSKYDECLRIFNNMQAMKNAKETAVKRYEDSIRGLNQKIAQSNQLIYAQQKKIFGKAKAQEVIAKTQSEIASYQKTIADATGNLNAAKSELSDAINQFNIASQNLNEAKNAYDVFMRKCGL